MRATVKGVESGASGKKKNSQEMQKKNELIRYTFVLKQEFPFNIFCSLSSAVSSFPDELFYA